MSAIVETERLILRRPDAADLPFYAAYYTGPRAQFVGGPVDAVKAFEKFCAMIGHWAVRGFGRFVFLARGEARPLGHAGALRIAESGPAELTWTIWDGRDEGRGYASEAAAAARDHFFATTGEPGMVALIAPENAASRRVAERIGGALDEAAPPPPWTPGAVTYRFSREAAR